jgi:uncharacterized protein YhaN
VLYGPNEAGKTTLLQFIRSMFYGFTDSRRQYFPPVHGGRPGGMAEVDSPQGRYEIQRHFLPESNAEEVVLTASDGTRQGEHLVKAMLSDMDEAIFNNVFAVELREMQELAVLGDTAAAEMLYNLSAGMDRVSLIEVLHELENSRNRILDAGGKPSMVSNLRERREKLLVEIADLGGLTRRFGLLVAERSQLDRELSQLEEDRNQVERQARILELAVSLGERWRLRTSIEGQLVELGPIAPLPEKMIERLDALNAKLDRHRGRIAELRRERAKLRAESANVNLNEALLKQFARIEALHEQQGWFTDLGNQIADLEAEIESRETAMSGEWRQLGFGENAPPPIDTITPRSFAMLRSPAKTMRRTRETLEQIRAESQSARDDADHIARQVADALSARKETNLSEAMDKAGLLVSQYRRRLQIDEHLDKLARHQSELAEQGRLATERQLLPTWTLAAFGTVFVLGILLIGTGLVLMPFVSGSPNWIIAAVGVAAIVGTIFGKISLEKSNAGKLDASQKQLALVQGQIKQDKEERDLLDSRLPHGGGPLVARLETAEKDLEELESLVPLESQRKAATQKAEADEERSERAEAEHKSARRKWRDALAASGLPIELTPNQIRQLSSRWDGMAENRRRLDQCREELDRRRKEADQLETRLEQVAAEAGVELPEGDTLAQLNYLADALAEEQAVAARRDAARVQLKQLRSKRARHEEAIGRLNHRRRSLFFEAGAEDEESFRQRAVRSVHAEKLKEERDVLCHDIAAAIGKQCSEEAIREILDNTPPEEAEARLNLLHDRLAMLNGQIGERLEKRGGIAAQMQSMADDRQLPRLQLEVASVDRQIADAMKRWRVLAVLCRTLEDIRESYERERQPETLKEASSYLTRLTQGRYCRVWTPLGEKTLRVDDADGHSLPVESLSRGTREQLFLSLRLALAAGYARRGAALPMVLDDVLVNFDAHRAIAAAEVLRDFAAAGHQLLVCTCHEHIEKIFELLDAPLNRLPTSYQRSGVVLTFKRSAPVVVEEPKREKTRQPSRRKPAKAKAIVEEPVEPLVEAEIEPPAPEPPPVVKKQPPPPVPKKKPRAAKKVPKPAGVFDVDFFESEQEIGEETSEFDDTEESEEFEEIEDDSELWDEEIESSDEEEDDLTDAEEDDGDEFEDFDIDGNGEVS